MPLLYGNRNFKQTPYRVPGLLRPRADYSAAIEALRRHYHPEIKYPPHFNKKYNKVKALAWLVIYESMLAGQGGLTRRAIANRAGLNYKSLSVLLDKWCKPNWAAVKFDTVCSPYTTQSTYKVRYYTLTDKGIRWLKRWRNTMPLEEYIKELEEIERTLVYEVPDIKPLVVTG